MSFFLNCVRAPGFNTVYKEDCIVKTLGEYIGRLESTLGELPLEAVEALIRILHEARLNGRQVFIMGNGGSASTASHFVCDLSKNTRQPEWPHFRVIGLADNMASVSAYANDDGYENVFAYQLDALLQSDDIVIGISTSGNSPNVLNGIRLANERQALTVGFTGFDGGQLARMVNLSVHVPSDIIEHVEDIHLILEHLICYNLRELSSRVETAEAKSRVVYA